MATSSRRTSKKPATRSSDVAAVSPLANGKAVPSGSLHDKIVITGARENNLKNISLEIPRDKIIVITGLSGSGKSSLAFDTIYAEGQRRYVESLSAYARQFLGQMDKPDVDSIEGLSPAVSIDQKTASRNPRSTVGTVTEIYDYLRILFARAGVPYSPATGLPIERQSAEQMTDLAEALPEGTKLLVLAPIIRGRKGEYKKELQELSGAGYVRVRVDGAMYEIGDEIPMDRYKQHTIEVVVDRLVLKEGIRRRLADSIETSLKLGKGLVTLSYQLPDGAELPEIRARVVKPSPHDATWLDELFSEHYSCPVSGFSVPELEPRMFSFNSPYGACDECSGLGTKTEFDEALVIPDPKQPVATGAIAPFQYKSGESKEWWPDVLAGVGRATGFEPDTPYAKLTDEQRNAVLHGLPEPVTVVMRYGRRSREFQTKWDGVLAALHKRLNSTESEWVRNDLGQYMSTRPCPACGGKKLKPESRAVKVAERDITEITEMSVDDALQFFLNLAEHLNDRQKAIAERVIKEIRERLQFLTDVGLGYLTLSRNANTLAGGEAQRIRLATQIGSGLMGCLYVLDEPSIGLHQRDNHRLIQTLVRLRDLGNTVLVVEHDEDTMKAADWLIDIGPGAGEHGGHIVNQGPYAEFIKRDSPTARFLNGQETIPVPEQRRVPRTPNPLKKKR